MSINNKIKQYGFRRSIIRSLKFILRKLSIDIDSYIILLNTSGQEEIQQKMQKFLYNDVQVLSFKDFTYGDPNVFNEGKLKLIRNRFNDGGYWSFGIFDNNKLIYSCWITTGKISFPDKFNKSIPLQPNNGLLEDAYCHPDYRGKGFHSKMNLFRLMKLHEKGKTQNFAVVLSENQPAMKSQLKTGFVKYKKVTFLVLFRTIYFFEKTYK